MSKTFTYVLLVIAVYVAIITAKTVSKKNNDSKPESSGSNEKNDKEVSTGASGRLRYQMGVK